MNPDRLINIKEMMKLIGKKRPTIYKMVKEGRLPMPVKVNNRTQGWTVSQYNEWLKDNKPTTEYNSAPTDSEILKYRIERFIRMIANADLSEGIKKEVLLKTYSKTARRILDEIERQEEAP